MDRLRRRACALALAGAMLAAGVPARAQSYRIGDSADAIAQMQTALTELDFYYADITGSFGEKTQAAVKKFQKRYGLPQTGVADEETLRWIAETSGVEIALTGGTVTQAGAYADGSTVLRSGMQSSAVQRLQEDLKALGYFKGTSTGHYGDLTKEAVRRFQKKYGLSADGVAGPRTLSQLAALLGGAPAAGTTLVPSDGSATLLKEGMSGDAVRALQENLKTLDYYTGAVTGSYGRLTKEAVRLFQRDHDLSADGVAGPRTLDKIFEEMNGKTPAPEATPAPGATASPGTAAPASGQLDTARTLRYGSRSEDVKRLQNALAALGYFTGTATGYYGTQTTAAVQAYQSAKGMTADGIAGRNTLSAINADLANGTAASAVPAASVRASNVIYADFYGWRRDYANGEHCTVYDYSTGISWTLRIMTKDAHMDAEPLTKQDTAAMTRAFGGKQDWTRKPVWVTFADGKTYMASTASAPHSSQHITTNDFKGHLCVHFPIPMEKAESIGPNAVAFQKALSEGWEETQKML